LGLKIIKNFSKIQVGAIKIEEVLKKVPDGTKLRRYSGKNCSPNFLQYDSERTEN
jgi:hypothetical protein